MGGVTEVLNAAPCMANPGISLFMSNVMVDMSFVCGMETQE